AAAVAVRRCVSRRPGAGAPQAAAAPARGRRPAARRGAAGARRGAARRRRGAVPAPSHQRAAASPHLGSGHLGPLPAHAQPDVRRLHPRARRAGPAAGLDLGAARAGSGARGGRPTGHRPRGALPDARVRRAVSGLHRPGPPLAV
ncbi:MAG: hypothetical protein AVDCRST_MAG38-1189, partial [uncultured Solirubrobacteraceae bacterium]